MEQEMYKKCLEYLRYDRYGCVCEEFEKIHALVTTENFTKYDEYSTVFENEFFQCRKQKMNELFVFDKEKFDKLIDIDRKLKVCSREMKEEVENLFSTYNQKGRDWEIILGAICIYDEPNSFIFEDYQTLGLYFHIRKDKGSVKIEYDDEVVVESINHVPALDFENNYAEKLLLQFPEMTKYSEQSDIQIGSSLFSLYKDSCLSLSEILRIELISWSLSVWSEGKRVAEIGREVSPYKCLQCRHHQCSK